MSNYSRMSMLPWATPPAVSGTPPNCGRCPVFSNCDCRKTYVLSLGNPQYIALRQSNPPRTFIGGPKPTCGISIYQG